MDEIIKINVRNDNKPSRDMSAATDNLQGQAERGNENDFTLEVDNLLKDLDKKYTQYVLDNKLGDFEKGQFDKIISEYKKDIQEAVTEKNKEKLEEIFIDIEARLGSDIEMRDVEVENNSIENDNGAENKNFNQESIIKELNSFFDELRAKVVKFEKVYKGSDKESCEKLERNIKYLAGKIRNLENIKSPNIEDMKKMMQLHDEIKKWTEENWTELHRTKKFELATRDNLKEEELEKKHAFSRKVADIARVKTDNYEKLNGATEKERDENFKNELKRILKDNLVVHGKLKKHKDTGEFYVDKKPDLDCKASLELIKMAKIDIDNKKIHYEREGGSVPGRINIDTGGMDGLVVLEDGTVFLDHHGKESSNRTSATEKTLEVLIKAGLLKDLKFLRNLVSFVNKVDNFDYPKSYYENYFTNSWKTLYGLSSMLDGHELRRFFEYRNEEGKSLNPGEPMDDELMRKIGVVGVKKGKKEGTDKVINKPASHKERVLKAKKELELMEKEGFIIDSERYGKICLNIDGRMNCGIDAAKAFGCDTYLAWNNNSNNFFISSLNRKNLEDDFTDGKNIRGTMWINPLDNKRNIALSEILNKMTDGKFEPSEEVKTFLGQDDTIESVDKEIELPLVDENEPVIENVLNDLDHTDMGVSAAHIDNDINKEPLKPFDAKSQDKKKDLHIEMIGLLEGNEVALTALNERFKNFLLANSGQDLFNKDLMKRIHSFESKFLAINKRRGIKSEKKIEQLKELRLRIDAMFEEDWEGDLKKNIESQEQKELIFTDEENVFVEKSKEVVAKFIDKSKSEFNWDDFPQKRIAMMLEIQAVALLMREFKKRNLFVVREEEIAEFIIKNIK